MADPNVGGRHQERLHGDERDFQLYHQDRRSCDSINNDLQPAGYRRQDLILIFPDQHRTLRFTAHKRWGLGLPAELIARLRPHRWKCKVASRSD